MKIIREWLILKIKKNLFPSLCFLFLLLIRETKNKENVTFLSSDEEISYTTLSQYEFVSNMSVENANPMIDKITSINIPYLVRKIWVLCQLL